MNNLLEKIKGLVYSSHKSHLMISDEDKIFEYEEICQAVAEDGCKIINAKSALDIRLKYELAIKESEEKYLIIVPPDYQPLPDILHDINYHNLSLKQIFPNLNSEAIKGLSYRSLCLLYNIKLYEELGFEKTLKYLLENLYAVNLDTLKSNKPKERLLNALIAVFLGKNHVNFSIAEYLTKLAIPYYPEFKNSILNREKLLSFLDEKWSKYVIENDKSIDFDELVLSKSIAHLFLFEQLKPIKVNQEIYNSIPKLIRMGVFIDERENNDKQLAGLLDYCFEKQQIIEDTYEEWFPIIEVIAKAKLLEFNTVDYTLKARFREMEDLMNQRFQTFIDNDYFSSFSLSGVKRPILVTKILDYIKAQPNSKKALLVIDGMNYWQALLLTNAAFEKGIKIETKTTMAYIPSITAWSRQAIFKGDRPELNEDNSKEESSFKDYWMKSNYNSSLIKFMKIDLYNPKNMIELNGFAHILGIVCNDLDDAMHGITFGNNQLLSSTLQWIKDGSIIELLTMLRSQGYKIFITSDHGNVEATGIKNLKIMEKVGSLSRSKRHLYFDNQTMLSNFTEQNKGINIGSKDNSVFLRNNDAFTTEGKNLITHGGSHFWEILIPFLEIE